MKIGIITYWQSKSNYGQILQMYALQQFLRKNGHEPFLIRYKEEVGGKAHFQWGHLMKYITKLPQYTTWFLQNKIDQERIKKFSQKENLHDRHFEKFFKKNIAYTDLIYTASQLKENPPEADVYICGSDQIWGGRLTYFLDFVPDDKKKIAWAPSFGGMKQWESEYEQQMAALLKRFDFIGMREQSGVEVCQRLGRTDAVKVVDPTLLLDNNDYDRIRCKTRAEKPYAFVYILTNTMSCRIEDIFSYVSSLGLDVKFVNNTEKGDKYEQLFPTIGEWIDLLAQSSLVITNSFHGTVFSLIYKRPFITIPLIGMYSRMNNRIDELLTMCHLNDRMYHRSFPKNDQSVDFSYFKEYYSSEGTRSRNILSPFIPLQN